MKSGGGITLATTTETEGRNMEEFLKEVLSDYAEVHKVEVVASLEGLAVLATIDLGEQGIKKFRIVVTEE